jgi:hypothetical protein
MSVLARILDKKLKKAGQAVQGVFGKANPPAWPVRDYPFNLRPNAVVRFDPTMFILAGEAFKIPTPAGDWTVSAIGEFSMLGNPYFRFYLKNLENEELILQIGQNREQPEVIIFKTVDELYPNPGGPTTWENWLDDEFGWIGCIDFHLPDGTEYFRVIQNPGPARINPVIFRENVFTENLSSFVEHTAMTYGREVIIDGMDPVVESLIIAQECDDEGALVSVNVGVNILPGSLTII